MEGTLADDRNSARGATVRVQRRLKALATGEERVRFNRLICTTWWVRLEARCLKSSGAMAAKATEETEEDY